jgi:processing peptidase subunit beta
VEEVLFDHLHATAFQHTGLGRTILGSAANVRSITKDNLAEYIKTHYTASRMVLVGTGAVDHDALVKLVGKYV